ncbi:hypothetical protein PTI45_04635 [Paenibacillus nuruki]|uniref:PrgI family protein n=1 Tax=Paenibacillus nuruki TaxID=1886670 RepID=A0A1E3KX24_9BACL|nr:MULTISPECIES: PrgI family protein [Paenibacillus]ODP26026.1 hypothetical protein PTI45_04635 [Paenibacillus nuruki]
MNNEIIVPIDITQEEKSILAILSIRQFFILFPVAIFCGVFFIYGRLPFLEGLSLVIGKFVFFLVIGGITAFLTFFKIEKHEQYASEFIITLFKFRRSQKTYTHL